MLFLAVIMGLTCGLSSHASVSLPSTSYQRNLVEEVHPTGNLNRLLAIVREYQSKKWLLERRLSDFYRPLDLDLNPIRTIVFQSLTSPEIEAEEKDEILKKLLALAPEYRAYAEKLSAQKDRVEEEGGDLSLHSARASLPPALKGVGGVLFPLDVIELERLLSASPQLAASIDPHSGRTAVAELARLGQAKALGVLLRFAPEEHLDRAGFDGRTPLHLAAQSAQLETMELLLRSGARMTRAKQRISKFFTYHETAHHQIYPFNSATHSAALDGIASFTDLRILLDGGIVMSAHNAKVLLRSFERREDGLGKRDYDREDIVLVNACSKGGKHRLYVAIDRRVDPVFDVFDFNVGWGRGSAAEEEQRCQDNYRALRNALKQSTQIRVHKAGGYEVGFEFLAPH